MKKLFMMAVMMVASATAFAGDSDALKAILKAKTYAEAEALVKSNLGSLASDAEKAKAYNKLVDLAMAQFDAQSTIQTENQVAKQMGKEEKPIDEKLMTEMAYNALAAGLECDKYDQQPNEKGKVAPKFDKKNAQRLWFGPRNQLFNKGLTAYEAKDYVQARKYWQPYVESDVAPIFKDQVREDQQKQHICQIARLVAFFAYQDKDMQKALELTDIAMKDPQEYEGALGLKLEILGDGLKTRDDSVKYAENLKEIYADHKVNVVMEKLYNTLLGIGQTAEADKILDDALAADPNNFVALADKGLSLLQAQKAEEAVKYLKKAYEVKSDNAVIATYAGTAYVVQAQNTEDPAKKKALYKEAITLFDKAKELDPDMLQAKWGYNRYNAYYNYYGENAPETKKAEEESR